MKIKNYFILKCKQALKIYPTILAVTVVTVAAIVLASAMILAGNSTAENKKKVSVGIVGDIEDTMFGIGVAILTDIDDSKNYVDFSMLNEEKAKKMLKNNELQGYIYIPEDFVGKVASITNVTAPYYISSKPQTIGTVLTKEVIDAVSVYIRENQQTAQSVRAFTDDNHIKRGSAIDDICNELIIKLLKRYDLIEIEYTGVADKLSTGAYYVCGLLLFFLLLWGISCYRLLSRQNLAIPRMLKMRGVGSGVQVICEYVVYSVVTLITLIIFAFVFGCVIYNNNFGIKEFATVTPMSSIGFVLGAIPVILTVCSMHILIYEAFHGTVTQILMQFLISVGLGYVSGCFYPNYFFPDPLRAITDSLPTGIAFSYMRKLVISEFSPVQFLILLAYSALFIFLAMLIRKYRMAGDEA